MLSLTKGFFQSRRGDRAPHISAATPGHGHRRLSSKIYDRLVKLRASPAMHFARNLPSLPRAEWRMWRARPYLLVNIAERMGLGANLSLVVRVLNHAQEHGLKPVIRLTNPLYSPAPGTEVDWLPLLFDRIRPDHGERFPPSAFVHRYWYVERRMTEAHKEISVRRSHDLLYGYMRIKPSISDAADSYCRDNAITEDTLAVHYRGTDKYLEEPRIAVERFLGVVSEHVARYRNVFVATDEPEFLQQIRLRFPEATIRDLECKWIFPNAQPAHLTPGNGPEKAREALMTMLVLSRCGLCIRTPSNLSHWARVLNPDLAVILVE